MTCIVGIVHGKKVFMGGDSAGIAGLSVVVRKDPKVFVLENKLIIGYCGSFRMGQLMQYHLKVPRCPKSTDPMEFMVTRFVPVVRYLFGQGGFLTKKDETEYGGTFLVGYQGRLFAIEDDFQVGENFDGFEAVGCGAELAKGSLHTTAALGVKDPTQRIAQALESASAYNAGVAAPWVIGSI